jgi:hypothetical protein
VGVLLIDNLLITTLIPIYCLNILKKSLDWHHIINNIKGGIIDFSIINNRSVKLEELRLQGTWTDGQGDSYSRIRL